jgi:Tfp pilus assembly PilM family ATPase
MSPAVEGLDFDPYRAWLNISERERPLSPYQLLALAPLEPDARRIRLAYERQQSALERHAERADPQLWQAVHRELAEAFDLLCDPEQKAVLDAGIRRQSAAPAPAGNSSPPPHQLTCGRCQRVNPGSRRFCGGCGASLWEVCPQCRAQCPGDERFCGACGADILDGLSEQSRELRARIAEAQELQTTHSYNAAISRLREVASVSDPRFDQLAQQALAEIDRVESLRTEQSALAEAAFQRAIRALESQAYSQAVQELEQVPAPLRSPEAAALLARARSAREELQTLGAAIRAAVEAKQTGNLLPKLERLLTLRPGHEQALALAGQLRDQIVKRVKQSLAAHRYQDAMDQLGAVPPLLRSHDVATLLDTAGELLALRLGVERSALADRQTLALAERLVRLAPANADAAALRAKVAERMQAKPADPRLGGPDFAPPPKRTLLGPPVDWLAQSARITPTDECVAAELAEHPGRFWVAIGLALQGLGLAAIPLDLTPQEKTNVLFAKIPGLSFGRRTTPSAWGLDLSDESLKAIKLVKNDETGGVQIAACQCLLHDKRLLELEDDLQRPEIVGRTLRALSEQCGELKGAKIAVALPGPRVLGRFFELPSLPPSKFADAINFEARHQLPMALDELCWQGHLLGGPDGPAAADAPRKVVVVAARKSHVRERLAEFQSAGVGVDFVTTDCLALHNALTYEFFSEGSPGRNGQAIGALDLGAAAANIVVSSPNSVWFRTVGHGGDRFTSLLVDHLNVTRQQAALLVREPAKARRYSQWCAALQDGFAQVTGEVERSLSHARFDPDVALQHLYGVGGGFQTHGLLRYLRQGKL